MEGPSSDDPNLKGIMPRMMETIFENIFQSSGDIEFTIKVSFMEIYQERIQDLLDPNKLNL